jgi:hypothetical protein
MAAVKTINFGMLGSLGYTMLTLCTSALEWLTIRPKNSISYGFGGTVMKVLSSVNWVVQHRGYINYPFLPCVMTMPLDFWILQTYSGAATSFQHLLKTGDTLTTDALKVNQDALVIPRIGIDTMWDSK